MWQYMMLDVLVYNEKEVYYDQIKVCYISSASTNRSRRHHVQLHFTVKSTKEVPTKSCN